VVLRRREFRGLVVAQVLSEWGDHIARVALAALILARTDSAFLAALAFVVSYVPAVIGSALLGSLADRLPRKAVLLSCDVARGLLLGAIALLAGPGAQLWLLLGLLFVAELFSAPFEAARVAILPEVLAHPREYLSGISLVRVLAQADQVVGLLLAGAVVTALNARVALALDAATFAVSFVVLALTLRVRPAAAEGGTPGLLGLLGDFRAGARLVFADPVLRVLVLLAWGTALALVAPEGVALAYARDHGQGTVAGGALLAAVPAGAAVGAALIARLGPLRQVHAILPLAAAACLPMLVTALDPPVWAAAVLWCVCGGLQAFMVPILATVNLVAPNAFRGRVNGLAAAGFSLCTAGAFVVAGVLADTLSPALAVAVAGAAGLLVVAVAHRAWPEREMSRALATHYTA
jgi:MFS family permease